ncbi:MAG: hypothetical protein C0597_08095 [Marinilabiliales bacterium]|nr:MAG: hypothetical protein C0597_08095 [Marinilabiliales bacterium]
MADKGFDIKVLIPTEDGIRISTNNLSLVPYYLIYNISNRSYQLAGKIKTKEILTGNGFLKDIQNYINQENIDLIVSITKSELDIKIIAPESAEINEELNLIIDMIDQKKELS